MERIDPIICGEAAQSADREVLYSVVGDPLVDVGKAPRLVAKTALEQARSKGKRPPLEHAELVKAAELFAHGDLGGETPGQYVEKLTRSSGLTAATIWRSMDDFVSEILLLPRTVETELPQTRINDSQSVRWSAAGDVFVAVMASNHPLPHVSWVQALFLGYGVIVRPGSRDPFTPRRIVGALHAAGVSEAGPTLLPSTHQVADYLVRNADRAIVYGDDEAVGHWRNAAWVATRGPGRSKALVDVDPSDDVIEHVAESIAFDGGTRCTNVSTVFTNYSAEEVANKLAECLSSIPSVHPSDPSARLLAVGGKRCNAMSQSIARLCQRTIDHTAPYNSEGAFADLGDGLFIPRPQVHSVNTNEHPAVGAEMPFPFVVVSPWERQDWVKPLRNSLVLNVVSGDPLIVDSAAEQPTIRKITCGKVFPWDAEPGVPHEGSLTQFLLSPTGIVSPSVG